MNETTVAGETTDEARRMVEALLGPSDSGPWRECGGTFVLPMGCGIVNCWREDISSGRVQLSIEAWDGRLDASLVIELSENDFRALAAMLNAMIERMDQSRPPDLGAGQPPDRPE